MASSSPSPSGGERDVVDPSSAVNRVASAPTDSHALSPSSQQAVPCVRVTVPEFATHSAFGQVNWGMSEEGHSVYVKKQGSTTFVIICWGPGADEGSKALGVSMFKTINSTQEEFIERRKKVSVTDLREAIATEIASFDKNMASTINTEDDIGGCGSTGAVIHDNILYSFISGDSTQSGSNSTGDTPRTKVTSLDIFDKERMAFHAGLLDIFEPAELNQLINKSWSAEDATCSSVAKLVLETAVEKQKSSEQTTFEDMTLVIVENS